MSRDELHQIRLPAREPTRERADELSRRAFLQLGAASLALAGLDGCARDLPEKILPYSVQPDDVTPGVPRVYATSMLLDGYATGLLVETREGRPIKIEGNPDHPASLGATGVWHQAAVLGVYDPDRARRVREGDQPSSWDALQRRLARPRDDRGRGLRLLVEPTSSPRVHDLLARVRLRHPEARVTFYAPTDRHTSVEGTRLAFGRPLHPVYALEGVTAMLVCDQDLVNDHPFAIPHARALAERRSRVRLYVVEPSPTPTGSWADHRLARRGSDVCRLLAAVARALPVDAAIVAQLPPARDEDRVFAAAVARDLAARPRGTTLVTVGERQPTRAHALAWAINAALGNLGATVRFVEPVIPPDGEGTQSLAALVAELHDGRVDTLLMGGADPVRTAPTALGFGSALARVRDSIYLGLYEDETGERARWMAPEAHFLEAWGDGRAWDGTVSLAQPMIRSLHGGRTLTELLAVLAGEAQPDDRAALRVRYDTAPGAFERALQKGVVGGTAAREVEARLDVAAIRRGMARWPVRTLDLELQLARSPTVHDGRFANHPWLLELPTPIEKLTWDNAALLSPATAAELGVGDEDCVQLCVGPNVIDAPVLVSPGHADQAVTLWLGYGTRARALRLARTAGVDAYRLRTDGHLEPLEVRRTAGHWPLARTQLEHAQHDRPLARTTIPDAAPVEPPTFFPAGAQGGTQWGMTIDLARCTGCSACMVACQAENNVLVVGKREVARGRAMHWLRIDTYRDGPAATPRFVHQPMMCQHCEKAPCEYVCPVNATVHSPDGLNEMVYNRCVGTRFCSNNCPYKVRRFNWFDWTGEQPANQGLARLQHNPEVTVRERGVMEKCSYCVQRIRTAEIRATRGQRALRPGEVQSACMQACPTGAIQFGQLLHAATKMVAWRNDRRAYRVLEEQGTSPRTVYLAVLRDPHPELGP